ncbi:MAG: hypothetical protein JWM27_76 [Gemmatimonadetes bacterium]|nr:hypothetical protein [Gemmatimonadota bacterium]
MAAAVPSRVAKVRVHRPYPERRMTPHRLTPALRGPLAIVLSVEPAGVICAGTVACAGLLLGQLNLILVLAAVGCILLDCTSGGLRAYLSPTEVFAWTAYKHGIARKALELHMVPLGVMIDWTVRACLSDTAAALLAWQPMTRVMLLALIGAEATSIIRNLRLVVRVPRVVETAVDALREGRVPQAGGAAAREGVGLIRDQD